MVKTVLKINGMRCGMCESHIATTIRNHVPTAKKVKASRIKNEASFLSDEPVDLEALKKAIDETGYECVSINSEPYEKKGLFGK